MTEGSAMQQWNYKVARALDEENSESRSCTEVVMGLSAIEKHGDRAIQGTQRGVGQAVPAVLRSNSNPPNRRLEQKCR